MNNEFLEETSRYLSKDSHRYVLNNIPDSSSKYSYETPLQKAKSDEEDHLCVKVFKDIEVTFFNS